MFFFFFFKQKTAYEMRISDWSSDVCSSDLRKSVSTPTVITAPRAGITNVRRHPPPARDPAQKGQRDPPVRQHRRAPAPRADDGLRHGRPQAAPPRTGLPRVRARAGAGLDGRAARVDRPPAAVRPPLPTRTRAGLVTRVIRLV